MSAIQSTVSLSVKAVDVHSEQFAIFTAYFLPISPAVNPTDTCTFQAADYSS
eukprot:gene18985-19330_t